METTTVSNRMLSLLTLYDMHSSFFTKALDGVSDDKAHDRLNTKANHIAWLTGSLVQQRYELAVMLGIEKKQASNELFANNKGIEDGVSYPPLESFKKDWGTITPELRGALINVTDEKLDGKIDMGGMAMSFYELVSFIIYREANCIGQLALWRRLLGYEALKYD
jgi:hypothetical protein